MEALISKLADFFTPWSSAFSDSKWIAAGVVAIHLLALLIGGGIAIAADRNTLRAMRGGGMLGLLALNELRDTHRPVLIGLAAFVLSGLALVAADINTFAHSPIFFFKVVCILALTINGAVLTQTERELRRQIGAAADSPAALESVPHLWRRLKTVSRLSMMLWIATATVGVTLANVA